MQEMTEVRFNDNQIVLKNNLVKSPILPKISSELDRDIIIQGNCVLEGPVFARTLSVQQGPLKATRPVFAQLELHINSDCCGEIVFEKAVGAVESIVSHAPGSRLYFLSDINARQVRLRNAYVAASIFADEVILEDCVVIGGVFATQRMDLNNCVVGTFNSPEVHVAKRVCMLLPSAFSVEPLNVLPGTRFDNLTLADLGALIRGVPEAENSGAIAMDMGVDGVRSVLSGPDAQQTLRTYSVAGKVLAADLVDADQLQNHFLLTAAALGPQLLRGYELGMNSEGAALELTPQRIAAFFFDLLDGKVTPRSLDGSFNMEEIVRSFGDGQLQPLPEAPASQSVAASPLVGSDAPVPPDANGDTAIDAPHAVMTRICGQCGQALEDGPFCPHCGYRQ
jgi:hypothetical protein